MSIDMLRDALSVVRSHQLWSPVSLVSVLYSWPTISCIDFMAVGFNFRDSSLTSSITPGWESSSSA